MSISCWLDQSHLSHVKVDYVIVGAGIAGLSTAYWLEKQNPNSKIVIIDLHGIGFGASGRNAGFVTCGSALHFNKLNEKFGLGTAKSIWNFSEKNRELLLQEIIEDEKKSVDFSQTGSATVIPTQYEIAHYSQILSDMKECKINVKLIDAKNLSDRYAVKESAGAIEYALDGEINPVKLLAKIKSKLKNTKFYLGEEVYSISSQEIKTQKNTFMFDKAFVCINGFLGNLLPEFKTWITPQRSQAILTAPVPRMIKGPCYLVQHLCYFRQLPTGELLIGGFRNQDAEKENTDSDAVTDKIQNALTNFAKTYFKNTHDIEIKHRWSGIMGFTHDGQMIVGAHPLKENIHLMAGCSSHGMGLSFHAAQKMVGSAFGEEVPSFIDIKRLGL